MVERDGREGRLGVAHAVLYSVLYTPGRNADAVAEIAVALLFAATRHVVTADADVRAGSVFRDGTIAATATASASVRAN